MMNIYLSIYLYIYSNKNKLTSIRNSGVRALSNRLILGLEHSWWQKHDNYNDDNYDDDDDYSDTDSHDDNDDDDDNDEAYSYTDSHDDNDDVLCCWWWEWF